MKKNPNGTAKLRLRHGKQFSTYYLDIHYKGIREQRNLGLFIYPTIEVPINATFKDKNILRVQNNKIVSDNATATAKAETYLSTALEKINDGKFKLEKDTNSNTEMLVPLFDLFIDSKDAPNTKKSYRSIVNRLLKFLADVKLKIDTDKIELSLIDAKLLEKFFIDLKSNHSPNGIRHIYIVLKGFFNFLVDNSKIEVSPFEKLPKYVKPKSIEFEKSFLTIDELKSLVATTNSIKPKYSRPFLFSCFSGLRLSDVQNLKWTDVRDGALHIRQIKAKNLNIIPLSKQATEILDALDKSTENVFESFTNPNFIRNLERWLISANVKKRVSFHSGRHTFATLYLTVGGSIWTLQKVLGHKNIEQTLIYGKIIDADKAKEIANFEKLDIKIKI